jgi:hypothetical protein
VKSLPTRQSPFCLDVVLYNSQEFGVPAPVWLTKESFDGSNEEQYSILYLLEHPQAWSRYHDRDRNSNEWRECTVIDSNADSATFTKEWAEDHKWKRVARFNLRFDIENEEQFQRRIDDASEACERFARQLPLLPAR